MARTILLTHNGADNGHYRTLVAAASPQFAYLAIAPTTRYLGVSLGGAFQSSGFTVSDSVWHSLACVVDSYSVKVYEGGLLRGTFTTPINLDSWPANRIGNIAANQFYLTGGLAPSLTLAPSTSLAPAASTYDTQCNANGTIDEVQVYDAILDDATIYALSQGITLIQALPTYPDAQGFGTGQQNGVIRSSVDAGPPKIRTRFTATAQYPTYQYLLTSAQKQLLDQFYASLGGSVSFNFTDPDTGQVLTARFASPPSYSVERGMLYRATVAFEVLP